MSSGPRDTQPSIEAIDACFQDIFAIWVLTGHSIMPEVFDKPQKDDMQDLDWTVGIRIQICFYFQSNVMMIQDCYLQENTVD